jgi:chaperone modulatory protein CbpM
METDIIALSDFCSSHRIEVSFIQSLEEHGLIQTVIVDQSVCVHANELPKLERIVRLSRELNINAEGLDVIDHLLKRIETMQREIAELKNRLDFYDDRGEPA